MHKIIGIDLGTTNSAIAVIKDKEPVIIPNREGERLTPSCVYITPKGKIIVGKKAKNMAFKEPERTVLSIKRKIGSDYKVNINNKEYTPEEICGAILSKLKYDAEDYLDEKIKRAVITVPAYFNELQRQATKKAGVIAGLEVVRFINEPTAAALAYGLNKEDIHTILVWDLGGGTFDVSILEVGEGFFEVKAVNGNTRLGGDDWDEKIIKYILDEPEEDKLSLPKLKYTAEEAKIRLSSQIETAIISPFSPLVKVLTREKFKEMAREFLNEVINCTKSALSDAGLSKKEIDRVILVGGATRMPMIRELARDFFKKEPYININPEEVVALGAAIQAGILEREINEVTLVDVTPLSLGIEAKGGVFAKMIERNTPIPASASKIFTTASDFQTSVDINVFQGEKDMTADNLNLGIFTLDGIPALPKGIPKIEVIFGIDKDGILEVKAKELETEVEEDMRLMTHIKCNR